MLPELATVGGLKDAVSPDGELVAESCTVPLNLLMAVTLTVVVLGVPLVTVTAAGAEIVKSGGPGGKDATYA